MLTCPNCGKKVSELDEKCKYCGVDFEKYEKKVENQTEYSEESQGYVTGYNIFLCIIAILIFVGGLIIGQSQSSIMFGCWIAGIIFLIILNMLKNIIKELRILNSKIK